MHIEIDDWFSASVFLLIVVVILLIVVFAAIRLAMADLSNRPEFSCEATKSGDLTRFTLTNVGGSAAFDLAVRSALDAYGQPFARTALLARQAACRWEADAATLGVTSGIPSRQGTVIWLSVEWRPRPDGPGRWTQVPVLLANGATAA